jgi:hypothetical protein
MKSHQQSELFITPRSSHTATYGVCLYLAGDIRLERIDLARVHLVIGRRVPEAPVAAKAEREDAIEAAVRPVLDAQRVVLAGADRANANRLRAGQAGARHRSRERAYMIEC